jgi:parallel beta-helix repeat protein
MLFLLLVSALVLAHNVQPVKASATIYIRPDGSIDPPTAPIQRDGDLYTLTGSITSDSDGIVVERDNVVLDGASYTVQGLGIYPYKGITLTSRSNVTIKNMAIKAFDPYGIYLYSSSNNTISGNNITNNYIGIVLYFSSKHNDITRNNITNSDRGIHLFSSSDSNTISGNNVISNGWIGVEVYKSFFNVVLENKITNSAYEGVTIRESSNNTVCRNNITSNSRGIGLSGDNNVVSGNSIANNDEGVFLTTCSCNVVSENNITRNNYGIFSIFISNNRFYHNNLVDNRAQLYVFYNSYNSWDNGYPSGGNYWSDYAGVDLYSGPYQNQTGSDGIDDTPYVIDTNNVDNYPLMNPWPSQLGTSDLSILSPDIVFSNPNPSERQSTTISAKIHNLGERDLGNISVRFFDGNASIGEQQISFISHHSQGSASIDWTAESEGFHLIKVIVDPENAIVETYEENNEVTRSILVGEIPHFGGIIVNGSATPNETRAGWPVTVQGHAEYNTTYGAGEPVAGADVTITIVGQERQWATHTIRTGDYVVDIVAPYSPGNYTVVVSVTDYTFWNSVEIGLNVQPSPPGVDLTLSQWDISFSPLDPVENDNVAIRATIHNIGTENASDVLVAFYADGEPIANRTIVLVSGGGSANAIIPWNATPWGWQTIKVVIDPENATLELRKDNNEASNNIYIFQSLPDLTPTSIDFSDSTPAVNQAITVLADVQNIGGANASDVLVSFYDGDQSIGNATIPWIHGKGEIRTASVTHSFTVQGWHLINATVDIENSINESDEGNNWQCRNIYVHLSSPDLTLSSSDITFSNSTPTVGDVIAINATIHNVGEKEAYDVTVKFYDQDEEVGSANIPWIFVGSDETVGLTWNATPVGWHPIKVVIVPLQEELDNHLENNNMATKYISISSQRPPDLHMDQTLLHSEDIVFSNTNPDLGENVTIYAVVHNIGEAEAQNVTVIFYIDDIQIGWPQTLSSIPAGENGTLSKNWIASQIGSHVVKVMAYTPNEKNKDDNTATRAIIVGKHDVAVVNATTFKTVVCQGYCFNVTVTVENQGTSTESFNVSIFCNNTALVLLDGKNYMTISLANGSSTSIVLACNTTGVAKGNYALRAYAWPIQYEIDRLNNDFTNGWINVTIVGDLTGGTSNPWDFVPDGKVDGKDIAIVALCFGSAPGCQPPWIWNPNSDVNNDAKVDGKDIATVALHFGQASP